MLCCTIFVTVSANGRPSSVLGFWDCLGLVGFEIQVEGVQFWCQVSDTSFLIGKAVILFSTFLFLFVVVNNLRPSLFRAILITSVSSSRHKLFMCFRIDPATSLVKHDFCCLVLGDMIFVAAAKDFLGILNEVQCFFREIWE